MLKKIQAFRYLDVVLLSVFFVLMLIEYKVFVNIPLFQEKMGFDYAFVSWKFILVIALFILHLFLHHQLKGILYFFGTLFLVFITLPNLIMYAFMPGAYVQVSLFLLLFHVLIYGISKINLPFRLPNISLPQKSEYSLLILIIVMLIPILLVFGFQINWTAFQFNEEVYRIRAEAALKATTLSLYLYSWLVKIVIPFALIIFLMKKKYIWVAVLVLIQLYLFSVQAQKSVFFSLIVIALYFIKDYKSQIQLFLSGLLLVIIASIGFSYLSGNILPESIIVRRTFFLPALNNIYYIDFFKDQSLHYSHSFMSSFSEYPFSIEPPYLIGEHFYGNIQSHVNNGFVADGFMNFGWWGVLLNSILIIGLIKYFDLTRISASFSPILFIIAYTLVSSYLTTSLLTHGIFIFIVLIFIYQGLVKND